MTDQEWRGVLLKSPVHAYFLTGDVAAAKQAAQYAADILLCEHESEAPCGKCQACQWMAADSHPDFHHIMSDKKRAQPIIRMETIRFLQDQLYNKPQKKRRVVWIEDAHTMRAEAQNALLKVLEDPPNSLVFLLSGSIAGVLPTVRSRCRIVRFQNGSRTALSKEEVTAAGHILMLLFRNGSRQAQYLLSEQKQNMSAMLTNMALLLHEIVAWRSNIEPVDQTRRDWVKNHGISWSVSRINTLIQCCMETQKRLKANANPALCADWLCIQARHLFLHQQQAEHALPFETGDKV